MSLLMDALKTAQKTKKENRNGDDSVDSTVSTVDDMGLDIMEDIEFESLTKTTEIMSRLDEPKSSKKEIKDAKYDFLENEIDIQASDVELPEYHSKSDKNDEVLQQPLSIDTSHLQLEVKHQSYNDEIKFEKKKFLETSSIKHEKKTSSQSGNKIHFKDDVVIEEVPTPPETESNVEITSQRDDKYRGIVKENRNVKRSFNTSRKVEKRDPATNSDARDTTILPPIDKTVNNNVSTKDEVNAEISVAKDTSTTTTANNTSSPVSAARVIRVTGRSHAGLSRKMLIVVIALMLILVAGGGYVFYEQKKLMLPMIAHVPNLTDTTLSSMIDMEPFLNQQLTQLQKRDDDIVNKNGLSSDSLTKNENIKNLSQDIEPKKIAKSLSDTKAVIEDKKIDAVKQATKKRAPVKVKKGTRRIDPIQKVLRAAYDAYQIGDDRNASMLYGQVIRRESRNRDALLGLAAVSTRLGSYQSARDYYITLLRLNNRDTVARSGLITLMSDVDPLAAESELKFLLATEQDASYLHFALGSALLRQGKWADAEEAFFDAFRIDGDNADYAYNLAVSLDRLGKKKNALSYYEKANVLARSRVYSFDSEIVKKRINVLKHNTQMTQ